MQSSAPAQPLRFYVLNCLELYRGRGYVEIVYIVRYNTVENQLKYFFARIAYKIYCSII